MSTQETPSNAKEWTEFLLSKELSSPFHTGKLVLEEIEQEDVPYAKLATKINADPVLSFYLMEAANKQGSDKTVYSKTLAHAMSMIGVDRTKQVIQLLPTEAAAKQQTRALPYINALTQSLYAAHLGKAIAARKKHHNIDDIYWSSLFLASPIWYLWLFAEPQMKAIGYANHSVSGTGLPDERREFHCTVREICQALTQHLALPPVVGECYQEQYRVSARQWVALSKYIDDDSKPITIDNRDLNMLCQPPRFVVQLANMLATSSARGWYSRSTLRLQKVLAVYLHISLDQAISLCHEVAASMSQAHPIVGIMLPAVRLFFKADEHPEIKFTEHASAKGPGALVLKQAKTSNKTTNSATPNSQPEHTAKPDSGPAVEPSANPAVEPRVEPRIKSASEPTAEPAAAANPPNTSTAPSEPEATVASPVPEPKLAANSEAKSNTFKPQKAFIQCIETMREHPENYTDLNQLMSATLTAMTSGLGLQRASISLINKEKTRLKSYFSQGCDNSPQLANFDTKLVPGTIFSKLGERASSVWVKPSSAESVRKLVPSNFKQIIEVDDYFLMSIFVKNKPFAMVYGDCYAGQSLTDGQYKCFKLLCKSATGALEFQIQQKLKPKS